MDDELIEVPREVMEAVYEVAEILLSGGDIYATPVISEKYGDTTVTYALPHTDSSLNRIKRTLSMYGMWRSSSGMIYRA